MHPEAGGTVGASRWAGPLLAVAGALAWAACFGADERSFLAWIALAPLCLLLGLPRAPLWGFCHGLVFWLASVSWLAPTMVTYGELAPGLALLLLAVLAAYLGAYHAAFAWLGSRLWRRGGDPTALATLPALWCVLELIQGRLFSGFPWNPAGYAWIGVPGALRSSSWIGMVGVSYMVLLASAALARAVVRRRWEPVAGAWLGVLLLLALAARWAAPASADGPRRAVRLVQPNIPILSAAPQPELETHYRRLLALSEAACDRPGALVVWPESAGWPYALERDAGLRRDLRRIVDRGCPVLLNSPRWEGERVFNTAFLVGPGEGIVGYDKRHLVPFGEYVPLGRLLPFVSALARNAGSFTASEEIRLLPWAGERLGVSICFEITFPTEVAAAVREGATILVTITNDAWYGDTAAPWQHLRAARFRAAENRRVLLRAALTGVSAVISADGVLVDSLGVGEVGVLRARVGGRTGLTPYARAPWLVPALCLALAASGIFFARRAR